jgi:hypothetical protein
MTARPPSPSGLRCKDRCRVSFEVGMRNAENAKAMLRDTGYKENVTGYWFLVTG